MVKRSSAGNAAKQEVDIDVNVPHAARMYDYMLGGTTNFAADRAASDHANAVLPGGEAGVRAGVRANRTFLGRAVRYLAVEVGVRQFLDIGTGIPNADNVHGVAQDAAAESRIVYVDNDPIVLAHSHALLQSTPEGATDYLQADLRDPDKILRQAKGTLDFTQPVGLVLVAILHFIRDEEDPSGIIGRLLNRLPSGSHLVLSHLASDIDAEAMAEASKRLNVVTHETFVFRSLPAVSRFFDGLELVEPGVVLVDDWRRDLDPKPDPVDPDLWMLPIYGAVGRKP